MAWRSTANEIGGRGTCGTGKRVWWCSVGVLAHVDGVDRGQAGRCCLRIADGRQACAQQNTSTAQPSHHELSALRGNVVKALTSQTAKRLVPVDCSNETHRSTISYRSDTCRREAKRKPTDESRRAPMWIMPSSLVPRTAAGTRPPLTNALTRMPPSNIAYSEDNTLAGSADGRVCVV